MSIRKSKRMGTDCFFVLVHEEKRHVDSLHKGRVGKQELKYFLFFLSVSPVFFVPTKNFNNPFSAFFLRPLSMAFTLRNKDKVGKGKALLEVYTLYCLPLSFVARSVHLPHKTLSGIVPPPLPSASSSPQHKYRPTGRMSRRGEREMGCPDKVVLAQDRFNGGDKVG